MAYRFMSQVCINAKARWGGFGIAEFWIYTVLLSILHLCFHVLVVTFARGQFDVARWVIGNAFVLCIFECIFSTGTLFGTERFTGRLRIIIASPANKVGVIMYNCLYSMLVAFATISVSFIIGGLLFGVSFADLNIWAFAVSVLVAVFSCAAMGLFLSAFALLTDSMYLILNVISLLIIIFSGANFPTAQLPMWVQYVSWIFPVHRSISAANLAFAGPVSADFRSFIAGEAVVGIVYILLTLVIIKFIERIAIKKAALEVF